MDIRESVAKAGAQTPTKSDTPWKVGHYALGQRDGGSVWHVGTASHRQCNQGCREEIEAPERAVAAELARIAAAVGDLTGWNAGTLPGIQDTVPREAVLEIVYPKKTQKVAVGSAISEAQAQKERAERAEARVDQLQAALAKYGGHQMEANANGALIWLCPAMRHEPDDFYGDPGPCDPVRCGFEAALEDPEVAYQCDYFSGGRRCGRRVRVPGYCYAHRDNPASTEETD